MQTLSLKRYIQKIAGKLVMDTITNDNRFKYEVRTLAHEVTRKDREDTVICEKCGCRCAKTTAILVQTAVLVPAWQSTHPRIADRPAKAKLLEEWYCRTHKPKPRKKGGK